MTDAERRRDDDRADPDEPPAILRLAEMTAFQRDVLWTLGHGAPVESTTIKHVIGEYYDEPIDHSRIDSNLDQLVEWGLVDELTDEYRLTETGRRALSRRRAWIELDGARPE